MDPQADMLYRQYVLEGAFTAYTYNQKTRKISAVIKKEVYPSHILVVHLTLISKICNGLELIALKYCCAALNKFKWPLESLGYTVSTQDLSYSS